jgi:WD40 repeat protein
VVRQNATKFSAKYFLHYQQFKMTDTRCISIQLLLDDAYRCLQVNFRAIQKHCLEIYHSALVWIPKKSFIRKVYGTNIRRVPKVILGVSNVWGQTELVMQDGNLVFSVAFSPDGSLVVSGSGDNTARIWNPITGMVEAERKGHRDGSRVASGSNDKTVRIWNTTTGELEAELKGHTNIVASVAFSQDSSRVVSGSGDNTVRIWNATTGMVEAELKGHTDVVRSVAFTQDGSRVVSGSDDNTVWIWNTMTGKSEIMTAPEITLPDASVVHKAGGGKFYIVYPKSQHTPSVHPMLSLSDDGQWIIGACRDCWIPSHHCDFSMSSFSGNKVCLGYHSGRVVILDMTIVP